MSARIMSVNRRADLTLPLEEIYQITVDGKNLVSVLNTLINHKTNWFVQTTEKGRKVFETKTAISAPPMGNSSHAL